MALNELGLDQDLLIRLRNMGSWHLTIYKLVEETKIGSSYKNFQSLSEVCMDRFKREQDISTWARQKGIT